MIRVRATKYDPSKRDSQGRFHKTDFTSASDVGQMFGNHRLTADDYTFIEDAYVDCVRCLFLVSDVDSLKCAPEIGQKNGGAYATCTHTLAECFSLQKLSYSAGVR